MHKDKVYVPNSGDIRKMVLKEMHNVSYVGHLGYLKTITTIRKWYYWPGMKNDVVKHIAKCMECQKVKVEHRQPICFVKPLTIPI